MAASKQDPANVKYVVKAPFVKVVRASDDEPAGQPVASYRMVEILRSGSPVPLDIDQGQIDHLRTRGLICQTKG